VRWSVNYSVYRPPVPSKTEVPAAAAASDFPDSSCTQYVLTAAAASDCPGSTCSQHHLETTHITIIRGSDGRGRGSTSRSRSVAGRLRSGIVDHGRGGLGCLASGSRRSDVDGRVGKLDGLVDDGGSRV
jgi:hypothetical protein